MLNVHVRSGFFVLLGLTGVSMAIGTLPPALAGSSIAPQPLISPTVCTTAGVCFEVDNNGHGIAVEGQALNQNGVGVRGLAPNTAKRGIGVSGQAFGPSSVAVNGVAFSTDASHASQGVIGISANGGGVEGTTTFNSTLLLTAASGVLGKDRSTAFGFDMGVEGTSSRGVGVAGISQNGNAVTGSSSNANGVVGQTNFFAISGQGQAGVLGQDLATPNPFGTPIVNAGVSGTSAYGTGVLGVSPNGSAVTAFSNAGTGLTALSNTGMALLAETTGGAAGTFASLGNGSAINASTACQGCVAVSIQKTNSGGEGIEVGGHGNADPNSTGLVVTGFESAMYAESNFGIQSHSYQGSALTAVTALASPGPTPAAALTVESFAGNSPLIVGLGQGKVMSLDQFGNMILAGTLTQNGTPIVAHRSPSGWGVGTYAAQETTKTVEDVGEAQLDGGQTYIRLDGGFASLMNKQSTYLVFLTPQGDCRGLYAAQKGPAGFYVRELGGGRSSIAFDYRIVARPIDSDGVRLPVVRPIATYHAPNLASLSRNQKMKITRPTVTKIRPAYVPAINQVK